ncbi:MAG: Ig-like domain-containing protein [Actinobacteria bacterium]|nr:Ig-like domain-containing protein [Actinomycetota bacterium]
MRRTGKTVIGAIVAVIVLLASATEANAAGVTTHAWMGLEAVDLVSDAQLKALLGANLGQVEGGGQFPDSGYFNASLGVPGGDYGEEAHWQRFQDAYADRIRDDPSCGDLTDPTGPCAPQIAHLMGMAAHGMGDEVWDWLFEPNAPDYGEQFLPPELSAFVGVGGIEFQMDMVAIYDHGRPTSPDTPPLPNVTALREAFAAVGRSDITDSGLTTGKTNMGLIRTVEGNLAPTYAPQVKAAMPWTSANVVTAPGGVNFGAKAIAAEYEVLWGRLLGNQPPTSVANNYPANGATDVPATGWERTFGPGSYPDRGGARNRIFASLSYARPYIPTTGDQTTVISNELPAGAMTLTNEDTGAPVPVMAGYPKSVPYGSDAGEHSIDIQPASNLDPCTNYRVDVTASLLDARQLPVTPMQWSFRTDGCVQPSTTTSSAPSTTSTAASSTTTPGSSSPSSTAAVSPTNATTDPSQPVAAQPVTAVPRFTG